PGRATVGAPARSLWRWHPHGGRQRQSPAAFHRYCRDHRRGRFLMYPSSLPNIDLQVLPTFPAHVGVTGVLTLVKSGLSYTFGLNFQNATEETNVSDMSKREVLVQDTDTGAFWRVKLTNLPTGQTDWGSIQNKPTEFPPSPIADGQVLGNVSG